MYSLLLMGISPVVIHIENIFHTDDILSLIKLSPSLFPNQEDTICKKSFLSQAVKSGRKKDEAWTAPLVQCFFSSLIIDFFLRPFKLKLYTCIIHLHGQTSQANSGNLISYEGERGRVCLRTMKLNDVIQWKLDGLLFKSVFLTKRVESNL